MKNNLKYSLGLDIGVASVGWAVIDLDNKRIHDLGVRIFDKAENPKTGESLSLPRRTARSARRRLKRRRQRLNNLKRFFVEQELLTEKEIADILDPSSDYNKLDVYELRAKALKEELTTKELFKVFYQIAKRRGFKSNRKTEEKADKKGSGRVLAATAMNNALVKSIENKNAKYETAGRALAEDDRFSVRKRNKRDYINSFTRNNLEDEVENILKTQKRYSLKCIDSGKIDTVFFGGKRDDDKKLIELVNDSAVFYQRPFMNSKLIKKMVGNCTFEPNKKRAPKASHSFEIFRLASDLSHMVYVLKPQSVGSGLAPEIKLTPEQIQKVINEAKNTRALKYKKVQKIAGIDESYRAKYIRGRLADNDEFGEENYFGGMPAYHAIKSALKELPDDRKKIDNEESLNEIAYVLTTERADEEIQNRLKTLKISDKAKEAIVAINVTKIKDARALSKKRPSIFRTFGYLSIEALQKITPYILNGMTYDKACEAAGYDFKKKGLNLEQITNPVVKRSILQTLKVVRAVEQKYGKPYYIKIETARELAKDFDERKQIEREQKENQANNQSIIQTIEEAGVTAPTGQQIIKVKLYREQNGKCLYSGKAIDFTTMLHDDNAYQIDHIIPFSRCGNDSLTNKTLVLTEENQLKGNKTPFEYIGDDSARWQSFIARVEATYKTRDVKTSDKDANRQNYKFNGYAFKKKNNLLIEKYKNEEWNVRALNDTRYITRFLQNYLRQAVGFAEGEHRQRVIAPSGTITGYLRKRWGLTKIREEDVLHHAQDAAVVAVIDQSMIQRANMRAKKDEIRSYLLAAKTLEEKTDLLTGEITDEEGFSKAQAQKNALEIISSDQFPQPWPDFAKEIKKRTLNTDIKTIQNELRGLESYDDEFRLQVKPIFVSRMAKHKTTGQAHKETIRSPKVKDGDQRTVRVPLSSLKRKDIENSVLAESDNWLYKKLLSLLSENGDDPKKAFAEPVYKNDKKFDKNGKPIAPVSSVKVYSTQPSGFYINDGKAFVNNGSMIRLDVYKKANAKGKIEHFFVPAYAHQVGKNKPTPTKILPAPKGFTDVDKTFDKVCSLYPNNYVKIYFRGKIKEGYYINYGINNGSMYLIAHHSPDKSKDNLIQASARSAIRIEQFSISVLGDNYSWS